LNDDFSFRISGDVEGDLSCDAVEIVESGKMEGTLEANWITIAGNFNGKIKTNQLTVAVTAVARGEFLVRDSIVIEPNADFKGQLTRPSDEETAAAPEAEPPAMANDEQADAPGLAAPAGATSPVAAPAAPTPLFGGANRPPEDRDDSAPTLPRITGASYDSGDTERAQPGAPVSPFSRPDQTS
jgi:cytoskeletal protein CcmA (bactofilin family)